MGSFVTLLGEQIARHFDATLCSGRHQTGAWVQQFEALETFAVEPAIAAQKSIALFHRVGADEKIRHHALAFSAVCAISPPVPLSREQIMIVEV